MRTAATELQIFYNSFSSICRRMGHTLQRAAYSVYVKHTCDFSVGIHTVEGETVANSYPQGVPNFVAAHSGSLIGHFDLASFRPGDVIISNDPYLTGGLSTHLPDICLLKPIFSGDQLVCFVWCFIHCSDVGGSVPGSIMLSNTEVYQEGLRIPPRKLYAAGVLDEAFVALYRANTRAPDDNWGDLQAGLSALEVGEEQLLVTIAKYGLDRVRAALYDVIEWVQRRAERALEEIPEQQVSTFVECLEEDGNSDLPVRMKVAMVRQGRKLVIDWSGTDPQTESAINLITRGEGIDLLLTTFVQFLVTLDPDIPLNGGIRRVLEFRLPQGSLVNPEFPAAGGARGVVFIRAIDLCAGCLSQLLPARVPAANGGVGIIVNLSEPDFEAAEPGKRKMLVLQALLGGGGARPTADGVDVRGGIPALPFSNSIEVLESECSIRVREWSDRVSSGGAGRFRGGNGFVFEFQVLRPNTVVTARGSGRLRLAPWGRLGGRPAMVNRILLTNAGSKQPIALTKNIDWIRLGPGDVLRFETPGGGGFGPVDERDPESVLQDVRQDYITAEAAERDYGIVIASGEIVRRHPPAADPGRVTAFDFGEAWDGFARIMLSEAYDTLLDILYRLPSDYRRHVKGLALEALGRQPGNRPLSADDMWDVWRGLTERDRELARFSSRLEIPQ